MGRMSHLPSPSWRWPGGSETEALVRLAFYAAERGEGDAEMARDILGRLGFCAACRHDRTDEPWNCTCGRSAVKADLAARFPWG